MTVRERSGLNPFLKMVGLSTIIHILLLALLHFNLWPTPFQVRPTAYTVTLMPVSLSEPDLPKTLPQPILKEEKIKPVEKMRPLDKPKKDDIVEKVKKKEKEKEVDREILERLQKTLEETRKKIAIDEIQKKVARREPVEEKPSVPPQDKSHLTSKFDLEQIYGKMIESKIKGAWTIPENLIKEMVDLEAIIVLIITSDGRVQKMWFEKKSGNLHYDQSALRAIKKAEPLPPIPKELDKSSLECVIRFTPD